MGWLWLFFLGFLVLFLLVRGRLQPSFKRLLRPGSFSEGIVLVGRPPAVFYLFFFDVSSDQAHLPTSFLFSGIRRAGRIGPLFFIDLALPALLENWCLSVFPILGGTFVYCFAPAFSFSCPHRFSFEPVHLFPLLPAGEGLWSLSASFLAPFVLVAMSSRDFHSPVFFLSSPGLICVPLFLSDVPTPPADSLLRGTLTQVLLPVLAILPPSGVLFF